MINSVLPQFILPRVAPVGRILFMYMYSRINNQSIKTTRQLLGFVVRRKNFSYFGQTIRDGGCELVKCMIQGKVSGKLKRGRPNTSYNSNITKWMSENMEQITRNTQDRAEWRRLVRLIITPDGTAKEGSHCTGLFGFGYPGISIQ